MIDTAFPQPELALFNADLNWKMPLVQSLSATGSTSAHKDFQRREFLNFPDEVLAPGKKLVFDPFDEQAYGDLKKLWTAGWSNQLPAR